ncbi:flagellar protein FlaG [Stutzerimonas stutzeri]|uniref:flagellar protein FlaG n=1 Tax=Stutzerimonas stutzeri TaxID=316 RepID=UPI000F78472C|nr:flagellar protein FlaG [Stutzerimonas stutzeri]RRV81179.1 flagellar protein FlaG [Stutzerimonas stutzeri]
MDTAISTRLPANTAQPQGQQDALRGAAKQGEAVAQKASAEQQPVTAESLEEAVTSIKDFVQTIRRDLNFDLDDSSGKMVVKVTDRGTGEVVRQIPTEEALRLAENLEEARSLLFKAQA